MSNKKSWQTPNLLQYGTVEQLTELSSSDEIQQINRLIMNGAGLGLFASAVGF
jgi:hypothetical protein